jgi:Protein of unknown function (DUF3592)
MNTRSSANPVRDMLVFLYTIGLVFSAIAAYFGADTWRFVDKASRADGTVVALKKGTFSQTWPIVAFETASGARIRFQGNKPSRSSPRFPIGTRLNILYDEREPSNARINTFIDMWGLTLVFGIIGLVFLALGTAVLFLGPRRSRPSGAR